jgi:hypothetical protein
MRASVRAQWVAALRSGEYEQTRGALQVKRSTGEGVPDGFCCLGVLCELAVTDGLEVEVSDLHYPGDDHAIVQYVGCSSYPPGAVHQWSGYFAPDSAEVTFSTLADMNDNGYDFASIADRIESDPDTEHDTED